MYPAVTLRSRTKSPNATLPTDSRPATNMYSLNSLSSCWLQPRRGLIHALHEGASSLLSFSTGGQGQSFVLLRASKKNMIRLVLAGLVLVLWCEGQTIALPHRPSDLTNIVFNPAYWTCDRAGRRQIYRRHFPNQADPTHRCNGFLDPDDARSGNARNSKLWQALP